MGKEHANNAHYKEICSVLDAWIEEEEEPELKVTIARVKPLIKVQNWTYVDEQDFSLAEEAERRKENARNRHNEYADYDEVQEGQIESEVTNGNGENSEAKAETETTTTTTTTATATTTTTEENINDNKEDNKTEQNKPESAEDETPEEKDTKMEEGDEGDEADGDDGDEKEELAESQPKREREERDDSVHLDDDMFHKLGYGITSTVTLTSKDEKNTATLHLYYSSHNWDIKDYEKPDFSLFCFTNTISLSWETANEIKNTENTGNTEKTENTENNNNNTTMSENTEQKPEEQKNMKKLITGIIDGDRKQFTTKVRFTSANLSELRTFLKYDEKDEIFFTEENFVMLLYFACVSMSIEDQPFNEPPALLSSRARRFFMKQVLYELGANVNQYKYIIENISYAMEEIKEQAAQDRYTFRGASSSKISFF